MCKIKFKIGIALLSTIFIYSCSRLEDSEIIGYYEIDKSVIRDTLHKNTTFNFLALKSNRTFKLCNIIGQDSIIGNWKTIKTINKNEGLIQFDFLNKSIQAKLSGNIFYFDYPNDFYSGFYESVLYVKLSKPPENFERQ